MDYHIRNIQHSDNPFLAQIIRSCFIELDAPKTGTVYSDPTTDSLYELFEAKKKSFCLVAESNNGEILGLCGIYATDGLEPNYGELVKFYLKPQHRGQGIGKNLMSDCLIKASEIGYQYIYIETQEVFANAIKLYEDYGFKYLLNSLGNSGHHNCKIWMLKELQ